MSITKAAPAPAVQPTPSTAARQVGAVASGLFAVALFMTVAAVDVPHDATDAALLVVEQSGIACQGSSPASLPHVPRSCLPWS